MAEKHVEVNVPKEVIDRAISEIAPHADKIGKRGTFDGNTLQKIMGRIGEIMTVQYLDLVDDDTGVNIDGLPDKGDIRRNGLTFDVKTSFSTEYKEKGRVPRDWGLLIPDSQFQFQSHDYYIRCAVDSANPRMITKLCFVGVCMKKAVAEFADVRIVKCNQPVKCDVLMRIVPELYTFSVWELKRYLNAIWGEH